MTSSSAAHPIAGSNVQQSSAVLWVALVSVGLAASLVLYPTYVLILLLGITWVVACVMDSRFALLAIVLTISSPMFLYLDRVRSTLVVDVMIVGACLIVFLGSRHVRRSVSDPLGAAAVAFTTYIVVNFVWAIRSGNDASFATNELIPVAEMYACYWLALRIRMSDKARRRLLYVTLALVSVRGAWQLVLFATGNADSQVPPVFERAELADTVINGAVYTKLFDPLQGLGLVGVQFQVREERMRRNTPDTEAGEELVLIARSDKCASRADSAA